MKWICFTQVPEQELVKMAAGDLDYSIRNKLNTQYLRDMAQLGVIVWQVEQSKVEKARSNWHSRKENAAWIEADENDQEIDIVFECVEENEVNFTTTNNVFHGEVFTLNNRKPRYKAKARYFLLFKKKPYIP